MSKKIGLVVCGNSGIDYLDINFPVEVIRSTLILDNKEYEDFIDIKADEFYDIINKNPDIDLTTSQTSTGKIASVYEKLKAEGYTDIIVITISSKLSGTYQGAILAKELVSDVNVYVVDSKSVSEGEMFLVYRAIELIKKGYEPLEIVKEIEKIREKINIYVLVDTLKFLVKNGRLSATSGFLGTLLKIKPLLKLEKDGRLVPYEKIRTTKKARERLLEIINKETKNKNVELFVVYTNNLDEATKIKLELETSLNIKDIKLVPLTPVVGAHAGPKTLAVGYLEK